MFRNILITAVLLVKLVSCTNSASKENATNKAPTGRKSQKDILQTIFRFSKGFEMFSDANGIPYQYHVPRVELILDDLNNGYVKIPSREYRSNKRKRASAPGENKLIGENDLVNSRGVNLRSNFCWRLAVTTRTLTALEQTSAHLWRRDPVPLNRLMFSLESPVFLGHFFYALTSLTEVNGSSILSRFYYAPVLVARYGRKHSGSGDLIVKDIELNVFSICLEPSDAPGDASIPLMHRPQRIIDAGLRKSSHNATYDVREKLSVNSTEKLNKAVQQFANTKWDSLFSDRALMAFRQLPAGNSPYDRIKTLFGDYHDDYLAFSGPMLAVFHGYDLHNDAYVFAHGPGNKCDFFYGTDGIKLLIFLNTSAHFKDESKLWGMCVDLWRQEMRARYGTDANSRLVHPHAYLSESASTAPYYKMLPRYDALGTPQDMGREPQRRVGQPRKLGGQTMPRQNKPRKRTVADMLGELKSSEAPGVPETIKYSVELDNSRPLERCSPTNAVPEAGGPLNPWIREAEECLDRPFLPAPGLESNGILLDSSAGSSSDPSMSGTCVLLTDNSYASGCWEGGFDNVDACQSGMLSESVVNDWLPSLEPNNAAVYKGTITQNELLPAGTEYTNLLLAESTYSNPLTGYLPPGPDNDEIEAELLAEIQRIDGPTLDRIHMMIQDVLNEPYLE